MKYYGVFRCFGVFRLRSMTDPRRVTVLSNFQMYVCVINHRRLDLEKSGGVMLLIIRGDLEGIVPSHYEFQLSSNVTLLL